MPANPSDETAEDHREKFLEVGHPPMLERIPELRCHELHSKRRCVLSSLLWHSQRWWLPLCEVRPGQRWALRQGSLMWNQSPVETLGSCAQRYRRVCGCPRQW